MFCLSRWLTIYLIWFICTYTVYSTLLYVALQSLKAVDLRVINKCLWLNLNLLLYNRVIHHQADNPKCSAICKISLILPCFWGSLLIQYKDFISLLILNEQRNKIWPFQLFHKMNVSRLLLVAVVAQKLGTEINTKTGFGLDWYKETILSNKSEWRLSLQSPQYQTICIR